MKKIQTLCILLGIGAAFTAQAQKIVIKGSDTLGAKLVPQLAEEFKQQNPSVVFEIAAEGSSTGVAAIIDSTADIGMSSREAKDSEISAASVKGVDMQPVIVGYDGIAVIVNENNPLSRLRARDVEQIFTGAVTDWSGVRGKPGKISVYTRNTSSGTYSAFKELAMSKKDYGPGSQKMAGNEQIASEVAKNPNGIGYVGLAYVDTPGVKVVAIDGALPTIDNIISGEYKYARPLYYYINANQQRDIVKQFIDFSLGETGQRIVSDVHFIPVRK